MENERFPNWMCVNLCDTSNEDLSYEFFVTAQLMEKYAYFEASMTIVLFTPEPHKRNNQGGGWFDKN